MYLRSERNQEAPCERKSLKVLPNLFSIISEQMRNISSVYRALYFTNVLGCDLKGGENYKSLWNRLPIPVKSKPCCKVEEDEDLPQLHAFVSND